MSRGSLGFADLIARTLFNQRLISGSETKPRRYGEISTGYACGQRPQGLHPGHIFQSAPAGKCPEPVEAYSVMSQV